MPIVDLASVDGQCFQQSNPGGARNVYACLAKHIVGNYPSEAVLDRDTMRITALPTLVATKKFSHYIFPDGTAEVSTSDGGDPGYQSDKQMIEFALAGSSDAVHAELQKHKNAGTLYFVEDKKGDFIVVGTTDDPIFLKKEYKLGKKGNDKNGYTLKGEVDGLNFGIVKLQASLIATLTFNADPVI